MKKGREEGVKRGREKQDGEAGREKHEGEAGRRRSRREKQ